MTQQKKVIEPVETLRKIRIVMVKTSHPGNIGAAARAMKNMGLSQLVLVEPNDYPGQAAYSRAAGADDILNCARVVDSLEQAISGCVWVVGASARLRTVKWPVYPPSVCVEKALACLGGGEVAIVFGRERSGLTNTELEHCNALLHIPTNAAYSSLNVASAVQILCYEFRLAALKDRSDPVAETSKKHRQDIPASADQMVAMYDHLQQALDDIDFFGSHAPQILMRRLKGLFNRATLTQREVAIMRGICSTIQRKR